MTRQMIAQAVSDFFSENGGPMDLATYKSYGDKVPVKDYILRKHFGGWARVISLVAQRAPIKPTPVKETPKKESVKKATAKKAPAKKKEEKKDVK
jgi:hypothetical protein